MKIVIATKNEDKLLEIRDIFEGSAYELVSLSEFPNAPDVEETGDTLTENAIIKAESAAMATGLPSIADDTGLMVDALNGEPGVRSSRFAGENVSYEDNRKLLLSKLNDVPVAERTAKFVSIAALVDQSGHITTMGEVKGVITREARGTNGFGYDPIFQSEFSQMTFGELTREEKRVFSHREKAFREMLRILDTRYA